MVGGGSLAGGVSVDQQRIAAEVTEHKEKTGTSCGANVVIDQSPILAYWWWWRRTCGRGYNTDLRHPAGGNNLKCPSSCCGSFLCLLSAAGF